jgi:alkylation response protein AidB-like acyl-CoA dehydrogenase
MRETAGLTLRAAEVSIPAYFAGEEPMSHNESDVLASLDRIATEVVAAHALEVDKTASFPAASIDALAKAGLLGAISAPDVGGMGLGPKTAVAIVQRLAAECGSTAMIVCMHFSGTAVLEQFGDGTTRRAAASGEALTTLAFSEAGSRSQFWAPVSTATADGDQVRLDARKSWVTSATHATTYVWSSKPLAAEGLSTLWLVPAKATGLKVHGPFDGLGLRGNDSSPVTAEGVRVPKSAMLGEDGAGFDAMMGVVLPLFNLLTSACAVGLMRGALQRTIAHASGTKFEHSDSALCELPTIRNYIARMQVQTDMAAALLADSVTAVTTGRADAMLRVLQSKAAAGETATQVLDTAMRVCGGAAFRRDVGVERYFRDGRAGTVMAPTTDVLYDFIGKAVCGMELL